MKKIDKRKLIKQNESLKPMNIPSPFPDYKEKLTLENNKKKIIIPEGGIHMMKRGGNMEFSNMEMKPLKRVRRKKKIMNPEDVSIFVESKIKKGKGKVQKIAQAKEIIDEIIPQNGGYIMNGQQIGEGWKKALGGTLIALGGLGAAGNIGSDKPIEGILGGAILGGIGAALIHAENKQKGSGKKSAFDKGFEQTIKKALKSHQMGSGKISKGMIKKLVMQNKDKTINIKDVFGSDWKNKGKILIDAINKHQKGGNIFKDIGHAFSSGVKKVSEWGKKAGDELKAWAQGKRSFKPSTLLDYASGAVGLLGAASAFIPGVDLISVPAATAGALGLKSAAHILKTSGRGMKKIPQKYLKAVRENPIILDYVQKALGQKGSGIIETFQNLGKLASIAKSLYNFIKSSGITLEMVRNAAYNANLAANYGGGGVKLAGGMKKKIKADEIKMLLNEEGKGLKLAGQGLSLSGGNMMNLPPGVSLTNSGKIKRDRYSVFHGYYPSTKSGLTKNDFMMGKGKKVISKRKHALGKMNSKFLT